jgi:hypothetical protein
MVRAQIALEYIMLLTLAGLLSIPILISVNSQYAVQKQFGENALSMLANNTAFNLSDSGFEPYANSTGPKLELRLAASQPAYVGLPTIVQATVYNYGSPTTLPMLKLESENSSLSLAPSERSGAEARFSYTLTSIAVPQAPGVYRIKASVIGEDGSILRSAEGSPLNATLLLTVLPAVGGWSQPSYALALERSGEAVSYSVVPTDEVIYTVSVFTVEMSENDKCLNCPPNPNGLWRFIERSPSGTVYRRCACLYFTKQAKVGTITPSPRAIFTIRLNVTNATNTSGGFELNQDKLKDENAFGAFSLASPPAVSGANPSSDSVVTSPLASTEWALRPASAYSDYRWARSDFEARLAGANGWCTYDCNGAISAANRLNERVGSLLSATTAYNCTSNATSISCAPVSMSYPAAQLSLNRSFAGAAVPCNPPDVKTVSGLVVEVTSCG